MIRCPACNEENPPRFRLCGYCGAPLSSAAAPPAPAALPARELRKTVTIVFADLKGSTALGETLDPEALHEVKERYFAAMAAEIARHGGTVEKYIGDAIMAVFGLPRAHEDDALRAVRAAAGMRAALDGVNAALEARFGVTLANRTGVNTGEVVASDDAAQEQKLATGDAVNLAARLEQAAPVGEVLIGEATWRLVRDAVEVEPVPDLAVKGKAVPVRAYRLRAVLGGDGVARRHDRPLVGRDAEMATLRALYAEVCAQRCVRMVTLVGDAGAGKSRLQREVLETIAPDARRLAGRCLPYGDGITFWPLSMMLRDACGIDDELPREEALARLHAIVGASDVAERLASVAGLSQASFPLHEINWAARSVLELMAGAQPVVALIDDIHWAEPAFLDLIAHVLKESQDAPILLVAAARPELLEEHPDWGQGERAVRLVLAPLADAAAAQAVRNLPGGQALPAAVVARIVDAADGNPLYAEQLLSMLVDQGVLREEDGHWVSADAPLAAQFDLPPTIQALLAARLDGLARAERATVEPASVIGYEFDREALETLTPEAVQAQLDTQLAALERKQFVRTEHAAALETAYRFHHHLVRDAVYGGLLKRSRAQLHLRFVRWAEKALEARALEMDEILGYHLEQAQRNLKELGPLDEEGRAAGAQGAERLARAARRVFARGDMHAAVNLYGRAAALLPDDDPRQTWLLPELAETLTARGELARARAVLDQAEAAALRAGSERARVAVTLMRLRVRVFSGEPGADWGDEALRQVEQAIPLFEREQAHADLARAWRLAGFVHGVAGRYGRSTDAVTQSMVHARAAGDERLVARNAMGLALSTLYGPTPVLEAIEVCESLRAGGLSDRQADGKVLCALAQLRAMNGEFDQARLLYQQGRDLQRELGQGVNVASTGIDLLLVELLAGDLGGAVREVKADYEFLRSAGETYHLSTLAALLSQALCDLGRDEEAMAYSRVAEQATAADDVDSQARWRATRAPIAARAGNLEEADALARSAVKFAQCTDAPCLQAYALAQWAVALQIAGRPDEARTARAQAQALFGAKGDRVSAARLHSFV